MKGQKELVQSVEKEELTTREREVLTMVAEAWTYKEIAHRLHISLETVKTHLRNIYRKLQVSGKVEALNKFRSPENTPNRRMIR
jgi:RNA polymerase sigma factor (sigma-70 family)